MPNERMEFEQAYTHLYQEENCTRDNEQWPATIEVGNTGTRVDDGVDAILWVEAGLPAERSARSSRIFILLTLPDNVGNSVVAAIHQSSVTYAVFDFTFPSCRGMAAERVIA